MFSPDVENLQNCLKVIKNDGILFMMPEARLSTAGKFEDIQDTTFRFIKKMGVPIYILKLNGDYLARPKWGDKIRKGCVVEASLSLLTNAEEVYSLSEKELADKITDALKYDEFEWLKTKPELKYKHKTLAEGLENILYRCPNCNKEFTINTKNKKVFCTECGFNLELDDRYAFTSTTPFENFSVWYDWQTDELKKEIEADPNWQMSSKVTLKMRSIDGKTLLRDVGEGVCTINRKGLTYKGSIDGEEKVKFFEMKNIYRLLFGAGEDFEIYEGKDIYYFVPENLRSAVKWYVVSGILKNLSE
jgi:transcription elongation factor Elf1